jgi:hypothetical protein
MRRQGSIYIFLAALAGATCTGARAIESVGPNDVSILSCRAEEAFGPSTIGTDVAETGHGIRIVFENRGTDDLSQVTFEVKQDGQFIMIEDVGRFSPGARIDHYFAASDSSESGLPRCSVITVQGKR